MQSTVAFDDAARDEAVLDQKEHGMTDIFRTADATHRYALRLLLEYVSLGLGGHSSDQLPLRAAYLTASIVGWPVLIDPMRTSGAAN